MRARFGNTLIGIRPHSLRTHLIAYGLALALPLLILMGALLAREAFVEPQLKQRVEQIAADLADEIDREIDRRIAILQTLATSPALANGDLAAFHAQAEAAVQDKAAIVLLDPSLQQLLDTRLPYGSLLPKTAEPATALRALNSKRAEVSNYFVGGVGGKGVFDIDVPILRDGEVRYILILALTAVDLLPILQGQGLGPEWVMAVWDRNDVVLARSRAHETYVGRELPRELSRARLGERSITKVTNVEGEQVLLASTLSRLTGWRIAVNVPLAEAEAPLTASFWVWGGAGALAIGLAILLGLTFARSLVRATSFASHAASALGRGEPIGPFSSKLKEANRVVTALRDASDALADRDRRQRMLLAELNHRVKNMLAVVQALVLHSVSDQRSVGEAREALTQRLQALAHAHDLLVGSAWRGASLREIVAAQVSPYAGRVSIDGPDARINAKMVQTLALIVHELCTNAVKYGALSNDKGQISIRWTIEGDGEAARFNLRWHESGGPAVEPPARKGFGSTLLEAVVPADLSAAPRMAFAPDGLVYEFNVPLATILYREDETGA